MVTAVFLLKALSQLARFSIFFGFCYVFFIIVIVIKFVSVCFANQVISVLFFLFVFRLMLLFQSGW